MTPLISIIIPVFNTAPFLDACIDSALGQTYTHTEILLVNDGSTDESPHICRRRMAEDDRIRVIDKENGGLSDARNAGMDAARGQYLTFLDGDDYLEPDALSYLYNLLQNAQAQISICNLKKVDENGSPAGNPEPEKEVVLSMSAEQAMETLFYQTYFTTSACGKLYESALLQKLRFPKGKLHEDMDFVYRAFDLADKVSFGNLSKYCYVQRGGSIVHTAFRPEKMDYIDITEEMLDYVSARRPALYKAAVSRCFSANFQVLMDLKDRRRHEGVYRILSGNIRRYRRTVLTDRRARFMNRAAAALSYLGLPTVKLLWRFVGKNH